jgi:hypothetical protein
MIGFSVELMAHIIRALMRRLLPIAVAMLLAVQAVPLLLLPLAWHCSCPVKGPCCRLPVCPMEASRHLPGTTSFAPCGGGDPVVVIPSFFQWRALLPSPTIATAAPLVREYAHVLAVNPLDGFGRDTDRPPRVLDLV